MNHPAIQDPTSPTSEPFSQADGEPHQYCNNALNTAIIPEERHATLPALPNEILFQIVGYFVPDADFPQAPDRRRKRLIFKSYASLRALCLTCRDTSLVATELLYSVVHLFDFSNIGELLRTLVESPFRASDVSRLSCWMNYPGEYPTAAGNLLEPRSKRDEFYADMGKAVLLVKAIRSAPEFLISPARNSLEEYIERAFPGFLHDVSEEHAAFTAPFPELPWKAQPLHHELLLAVLRSTPSLGSLLIQTDASAGRGNFSISRSAMTKIMDGSDIANPTDKTTAMMPCPRLKEMTIWGERSIFSLPLCALPEMRRFTVKEGTMIWEEDIQTPFASELFARRRFEVRHDLLFTDLRNIQQLDIPARLVQSCSASLRDLLSNTRDLRSLKVSGHYPDLELFPDGNGDNWNEVLPLVAATLEEFRWDLRHPLRPHQALAAYGSDRRLTCLARFKALKSLTLPFRSIFGPIGSTSTSRQYPDYLPPNLESLTLVEENFADLTSEQKEDARNNRVSWNGTFVGVDSRVYDILKEIPLKCGGLLRHLERARFLYEIWEPNGRNHWVLDYHLLEKVRSAYRKMGAEFSVGPRERPPLSPPSDHLAQLIGLEARLDEMWHF